MFCKVVKADVIDLTLRSCRAEGQTVAVFLYLFDLQTTAHKQKERNYLKYKPQQGDGDHTSHPSNDINDAKEIFIEFEKYDQLFGANKQRSEMCFSLENCYYKIISAQE